MVSSGCPCVRPFLRSRSKASARRCVRSLLVPVLVFLHNDEQGVKITHPQDLHQPPPQLRRRTAFPPHQLGHVTRGNPAAARQLVLRDVELVQQFPYHRLPELHPDRAAPGSHLACSLPTGSAPSPTGTPLPWAGGWRGGCRVGSGLLRSTVSGPPVWVLYCFPGTSHTDSIGCHPFSESLGKPDWSEAFPTNVHCEVQVTPTHQS